MTDAAMKDRQRQAQLHQQWRAGDESSKEQLLDTLKGLIIKSAYEMRNTRIERDDLKSEATIAALEAIELWEPDRGTLAATATPIIKGRLVNIVRTSGSAAFSTTSRPDRKMNWHLYRHVSKFEKDGFSRSRSIELAANHLGVDPKLAEKFLEIRGHKCLDSVHDLAAETVNPADEIGTRDARQLVNDFLYYDLNSLEHDLMKKLINPRDESLDVIAQRHGTSRARVTRTRDALKEKLRERCKRLGITPEDVSI